MEAAVDSETVPLGASTGPLVIAEPSANGSVENPTETGTAPSTSTAAPTPSKSSTRSSGKSKSAAAAAAATEEGSTSAKEGNEKEERRSQKVRKHE